MNRSSRAVASSAESRSGRHGGYDRRISTSAPASLAAASIVARTSSSASAFALRVIDASVSTPSSVLATFRLVLVSTTPLSFGLMAIDAARCGSDEIEGARSGRVDGRGGAGPRCSTSSFAPPSEAEYCFRSAATSASAESRNVGLGRRPQRHHGSRLARDCVPAHASFEADEPKRHLAARAGEDTAERLDRVDAPARDVSARVAAAGAGQPDLDASGRLPARARAREAAARTCARSPRSRS